LPSGAAEFAGDGHGGRNAAIEVMTDSEEAIGLGFDHDPDSPEHLSVADDRLSVRFSANRNAVDSAVVVYDGG